MVLKPLRRSHTASTISLIAMGAESTYSQVGTALPALQLAKTSMADRLSRQSIAFLHQHRKKEDIHFLRDLLETGKVIPVIDRVFPLEEAAEALRYQGAGRARGKVVVAV